MNIVYNLQIGKKSNQLMIRLYKNKFDVSCSIGISLDAGDWNQELQLANSSIINQKLSELKSNVLKAYNESFIQGTIIDKDFVKNIISECFNRPTKEISQVNSGVFVYYSDFANNWLKTKADQWKISAKQTMPKYLKKQYEDFLELFLDYEKMLDGKLVLKDLSIDDFYGFVNHLEDEGYNPSTIKRTLSRMKFFCSRASEEGIKVSSAFTQRVFVDDDSSEEINVVYLNEEEIFKIHTNTDWASDLYSKEDLEDAKDNLVLSCLTSLRISDFMGGLDISKIKNNVIQIKTKKTHSFVRIPLHPFIKEILNNRFNNLPKKFSHTQYNLLIKEVCKICGINELTYGKLWDAEIKRKKLCYKPKYYFICSHSARRSFVSNLRGKVSDNALMSFGGWKSLKIMEHYDKNTNEKYVKELEEYFNQNKK